MPNTASVRGDAGVRTLVRPGVFVLSRVTLSTPPRLPDAGMITLLHTVLFGHEVAIAVKLSHRAWCRWCWLDEAGLAALQIGPVVVEWAW